MTGRAGPRWRGAWLGLFIGWGALANPPTPVFLPTPSDAARVWRVDTEATSPTLYRLLIVPGSGCPALPVGAAPAWRRAFPDAELWVLQKPWLDRNGGCSPQFASGDRLSRWQQAAVLAVRALPRAGPPLLVLALSEGAEIAPALMADRPDALALVTVGAPGADPAELAHDLYGHDPRWHRLRRAAQGDGSDQTLVDGRSLGYWRDLLTWRVSEPLMQMPQLWIRAWGLDDEFIPAAAFARAKAAWVHRRGPTCDRPVAEADHALQGPRGDGLAGLGAWLREQLVAGSLHACSAEESGP